MHTTAPRTDLRRTVVFFELHRHYKCKNLKVLLLYYTIYSPLNSVQ
jgi:hypothetical protein